MFIRLIFQSILFIDIVDTYFVLCLTFVLCVFNLFIIHYEEVDLPLYVKGWSGGIMSIKGPLGKVRFLSLVENERLVTKKRQKITY